MGNGENMSSRLPTIAPATIFGRGVRPRFLAVFTLRLLAVGCTPVFPHLMVLRRSSFRRFCFSVILFSSLLSVWLPFCVRLGRLRRPLQVSQTVGSCDVFTVLVSFP